MNDYEKRNLDEAQRLADELGAFYPSTVAQDDNGPIVLLERNGKTYRVRKDYQGRFIFAEHPYYFPKMINSDQRKQSQEVFTSHNIKVLSKKKIDTRLDEVDKSIQMQKDFEQANREKVESFLAEVRKLEGRHKVEYFYHREYYTDKDGAYKERKTNRVKGGEIVTNGVCFEFTIDESGYISKKLELHYSVNATLEAFEALSANDYRHEAL